MRIVMLMSQLGSRDGIKAERFVAGQEYDLTHNHGERDLASVFVREGWAKEAVVVAQETMAAVEAPENKALPDAEEVKTPRRGRKH